MKNIKHRIPIIVVVGVIAALMSFGVAYAAMVQWRKEVPATVVRTPVTVLPGNAMGIYFDKDCTDSVEELNFKAPEWQPPLDKFAPSRDEIPVFIRNNSDYTLRLVESPPQHLHAMVNGEETHVGNVDWYLNWRELKPLPDEKRERLKGVVVEPGEVLPAIISLHLESEVSDEFSFTVTFGAVGTEEGEFSPESLKAPAQEKGKVFDTSRQ